jgi:hypothetical protein
MKIKKYRHENVKEDGTHPAGGSVVTRGRICRSEPGCGGCSEPTCRCSQGHWISITEPRTSDGVVVGITVEFDDREEMDHFMEGFSVYGERV